MEKDIYEYEAFMPASSSEGEPTEQFFVVQNDGTLLINRSVQYVTQVEDVKGVLENVQHAIYDVGPQQYYVNNVISVSDELVLPQDGSSNVYENSFLFQETETVQMSETISINDIQQEDTGDNAIQVPDNTSLTEVTLNDDQYRTLEEKGWVLLETINDKVYLLNTLGLHDITGNEKLIQELRMDQETHIKIQQSEEIKDVKDENPADTLEEVLMPEELPSKQETEEQIAEENTVKQCKENTTEKNINARIDRNDTKEKPVPVSQAPTASILSRKKKLEDYSIQNHLQKQLKKNRTVVRLQIKFSSKDIPNKMVLGRTKNGKRLVAKVIDIKRPPQDVLATENTSKEPPVDDSSSSGKLRPKTEEVQGPKDEIYYKATEVNKLIQQHINGKEPTCSAEDVSSAEAIVRQLLNVPSTRAPMVGRNMCITKIVKKVDKLGRLEGESDIVLVTGRVTENELNSQWDFIYVPRLLFTLRSVNSKDLEMCANGDLLRKDVQKSRDDYMLHIHIMVTKQCNAPDKTSITFTKLRATGNLRKAVHACSACAKIFDTRVELKEHQEAQCLDAEDEKPPLIIDTDKISNHLIKRVQGSKNTICKHCKESVKSCNLRRHLHSHFGPEDSSSEENNAPSKYKCKMCPSSYYYSSSLSKHIMGKHIKEKVEYIDP